MRVSRFFSLTVLLASGLSFVTSSALAQATPSPAKQTPAKPAATPAPAKAPAPAPAKAPAPATTPAPAKAPTPAPAKAPAPAPAKAPATPAPAKPTAGTPAPTTQSPDKQAPPAQTPPAQTPPEQPAGAQTPKEKADALVVAGRKLVDAHEADKAVGLLEEAHGILLDPESGFELMRAYTDVGKLVEALTLGEKLAALPVGPKESQGNVDARKKIKDAVSSLATRVPTIQLQVQRPAKDLVRVKVDERTLLPEQLDKPIRVNPGKREILVTAPGYEPLTIPQEIEQGTAKQYPVTVNMNPVATPKGEIHTTLPEEPPSPPLNPLVKVGIGVSSALGVVAIASGIGAGVSYVGFVDAYNRRGCGANCDAEVADRRPTLQALSIIWPIAGALAIAGGTLTFVYARKDQKTSETVGWSVAPTVGGFVVHGRW